MAPDEETTWMDRAWILQETQAPRSALVLFAWNSEHISAKADWWGQCDVDVVVPRRSALAPLRDLIAFSFAFDEQDKLEKKIVYSTGEWA